MTSLEEPADAPLPAVLAVVLTTSRVPVTLKESRHGTTGPEPVVAAVVETAVVETAVVETAVVETAVVEAAVEVDVAAEEAAVEVSAEEVAVSAVTSRVEATRDASLRSKAPAAAAGLELKLMGV